MRPFLNSLIFIFIFSGCAPLNRVSNRDMADMYDPAREIMAPQYLVYNITDTTTRLFVKVNTDNILYQNRVNSKMEAELKLTCRIFTSYDTDRFSDTCSVNIVDVKDDDVAHSLIHFVDFKTPRAGEYVLELLLTDINRRMSQKTYYSVNNKSRQSAVNFLVVQAEDSIPLFDPAISSTTNFRILCRNGLPMEWYVRYFNRRYPLAAPAFRNTELDKFNYRADQTYKINLSSTNEFNFKATGIYHIQADSTILHGLTLYRFSDDYPRQTIAAELVEPLRYLTTSEEYNRIMNSKDKKAAIDDFWLDIAGNKTKGRELIRIFYSRVETANRLFTSYHEGWKTDRGLMYIIYGEPDVVYRGGKTEDWNYSSTFERGPVNFTFEKVSNPFTDQDSNLQRSLSYRDIWLMAVDEWRQGRPMEVD